MEKKIDNEWDITMSPSAGLIKFNLLEVWKYRDLMFLLVKRDFIAFYKQTILVPLWFLIQPIFTTFTFVFIFGNLAKISTEGIPSPLFYICSISAWSFFSECLTKTSSVFRDNIKNQVIIKQKIDESRKSLNAEIEAIKKDKIQMRNQIKDDARKAISKSKISQKSLNTSRTSRTNRVHPI